MNVLLQHEAVIRLGAFAGVLGAMAVAERCWPRRGHALPRAVRWPGNFGLAVIDTLVTRVLAPAGAVGFALAAEARGWGALPAVGIPAGLAVLLGFVLLDLAIYFQHRLFHALPWLWRMHRVHHADLDFDVTTGVRFHPVEIALSLAIKAAVIIAVGVPGVSVLVFEVVLSATSLFNHTDLRLPDALDRRLRWLVVTPDMHRVHHSILRRETDSNFGFNLPWWDRLFATYRHQPEATHEKMTIGIEQFRAPRELRLDRMLTQPFRNDSDGQTQ